jgi:hypothetical protein
MGSFSAITIFCEDIREEVGGTETLIGIMPDNVQLPVIPFHFPKICIYTRIHLTFDFKPEEIKFFLKFPDNSEQFFGETSAEQVRSALTDSHSKNNLITGLIFKVKIANLPIKTEGKLVPMIKFGTEEFITGTLNIMTEQKK